MKHIVKNMIPYWKSVIVILLLLCTQAYCDLSLPLYTSNIIDVGIVKGGVNHIFPEKIKAEEFEEAQILMSDEEKELWTSLYKEDGEAFLLAEKDEAILDEMDEKLIIPIVSNYQMGRMEETTVREYLKTAMEKNPLTALFAKKIDSLSLDELSEMAGFPISSFQVEDEDGTVTTYVDIRPMIGMLMQSGTLDDSMITQSREMMEKAIEQIGSSTLKSMGVQYALACDESAGLNLEKIQMSYLWRKGGQMALLSLVLTLTGIATAFFASRVGAGIGRDLRGKVFGNVMGYSNAEINHFSSASLITRATNDVQQIQMVSAIMLRMVLYAPIIGIGGVYRVMQTGTGMEWIIAVAVASLISFVLILVAVAMPKFKLMQKKVDAVNLASREILTGLAVIRAFGREKTEEDRFDIANNDLRKTQLFTNRVMTFMMPGMTLIMNLIVVLITWTSAQKIDAGTLQVGTMTAFITYTMQIVMSFLMLTAMSILLPRAGVAADRINEVITTRTSIADPENPKEIANPQGVVRFEHVSFRYPGAEEDVLHDMDFVAEPGKVTAIIGGTGSGKSTLVNLIPRFYDVTEGRITVDGHDIRELSLLNLRDQIGFVPQKGVLFSGTIDSNLRFGKTDATEAEIREAAEIAQATEFIEEKNDKYDSYIAQGGRNVSGGQKQRLAIARAIAKDPRIFVFDDSFSALDMKTDAKLRKALEEKVTGRTEIIVAQRISTILHADQILVLDEGEIVGKGTHEELLRSCEVYRQIAVSQLSAKELGLDEDGKEVAHE